MADFNINIDEFINKVKEANPLIIANYIQTENGRVVNFKFYNTFSRIFTSLIWDTMELKIVDGSCFKLTELIMETDDTIYNDVTAFTNFLLKNIYLIYTQVILPTLYIQIKELEFALSKIDPNIDFGLMARGLEAVE